jgi:hypothetical protein
MRGSINPGGFRLGTCLVLIAIAGTAPCAVHAQLQVPPAPPPAPPRRFSSGLTDAAVAYARPAGDRGAGQLVLGGACRSRLWNRVTIGPEGFYLRGAGGHRTLMLSASAAIDLVPDLHTREPRVRMGVLLGRRR